MTRQFLLLVLLLPLLAAADERILSFHGDIVVRQDGRIQVTETIRVRAEGDRIHRGIYRDVCCLLYTSPSPRDKRQSRMPSSA